MIRILVGSMTGTADLIAERLLQALAEGGESAESVRMETLSARAMEGCGVVIVVCSTYGKGQVPDNAVGFYNDLRDIRPDLTRMQFGVVALGDKRYARTFANGGKRFAALFEELGARQIGDLMEHDASSAIIPEDAALAWLRCWVPQMQGAQK